jgi:hypothetical protein
VKNIIIITVITIIQQGAMVKTTIAVSPSTRDLLRELGNKGDTYDDIILRLLRDAGWKHMDTRWNEILRNDAFIPLDEL